MELEVNFSPATTTNSNPPILFVHGMAHAAWCWEWKFIPYFNRKGFDCYAVSLRGHGASMGKNTMRWFRIADYVNDVKEVLSKIHPTPVIIGHSMGGFIIQKLLTQGADLPAAVLLSSVPHNGMLRGSVKTARYFPWQFIKGNLTLSTAPFSETESIVKTMVFSKDIDADTLSKTQKTLESESYMAYLDMLLLDLHKPKLVSKPVLFLHGEDDFIVDGNACAATAKGFGADFLSMPNMAHDMMLDTRWPEVAAKILEWLLNKSIYKSPQHGI